MFGGIQRPETARPERYAAACLAAAGPIKAVMRPRACVGVGAAIARPQRRRPGSGSAPSGDGSGRLEKLPSFAPVAEPMFHQRRCGAHPDGAGEHQDSAKKPFARDNCSLSQSSKPKRRGGCTAAACRSRLSCPLNPLEPLTQPLRHVLDRARRVHVLRDELFSPHSPACTSSRGDAPSKGVPPSSGPPPPGCCSPSARTRAARTAGCSWASPCQSAQRAID